MTDRDHAPSPRDGPALPLAREALARRKRRDVATVLPLAGIALLVSPFLNVVADAGTLFGLPVKVIYVFAVWFGLIAATRWLALRLREDAPDG